MGTRHLICVFYKGRFVVAQYGSCDGYPEGQGAILLKFLQESTNIQRLKDGLEHTYKPSELDADEAKRETDELRGLEALAWWSFVKYCDSPITSRITDFLWPSLHESTGAGILEVIAQAGAEKKVPIQLKLSFANDGFSCEGAYVVDLDAEVFEVFGGAEEKTPGHRFGDVGEGGDMVPSFIASLTLSELQEMETVQEFLDRVGKAGREKVAAVRATLSNVAGYRVDKRQDKRQTLRKRDGPPLAPGALRPSKRTKRSSPTSAEIGMPTSSGPSLLSNSSTNAPMMLYNFHKQRPEAAGPPVRLQSWIHTAAGDEEDPYDVQDNTAESQGTRTVKR